MSSAAPLDPALRDRIETLLSTHPVVLFMEKFCEKLKSRSNGESTQSDHIMDIITLVQAAKAEKLLHNQEEIIMIHAATLSARRPRRGR